jgi:hypothetical protein
MKRSKIRKDELRKFARQNPRKTLILIFGISALIAVIASGASQLNIYEIKLIDPIIPGPSFEENEILGYEWNSERTIKMKFFVGYVRAKQYTVESLTRVESDHLGNTMTVLPTEFPTIKEIILKYAKPIGERVDDIIRVYFTARYDNDTVTDEVFEHPFSIFGKFGPAIKTPVDYSMSTHKIVVTVIDNDFFIESLELFITDQNGIDKSLTTTKISANSYSALYSFDGSIFAEITYYSAYFFFEETLDNLGNVIYTTTQTQSFFKPTITSTTTQVEPTETVEDAVPYSTTVNEEGSTIRQTEEQEEFIPGFTLISIMIILMPAVVLLHRRKKDQENEQ